MHTTRLIWEVQIDLWVVEEKMSDGLLDTGRASSRGDAS
jgi:hypothetical protein